MHQPLSPHSMLFRDTTLFQDSTLFQDPMTDDHLTMQVPATARSAALIRLAAAQLAAQCGFDYDRVEDVRIAVSEAIRILIGEADDVEDGQPPGAAQLDTTFTVEERSLTVSIRLEGGSEAVGPEHDTVSILEATTTSFAIDSGRSAPQPASPVVMVQFGTGRATGAIRERTPGRED